VVGFNWLRPPFSNYFRTARGLHSCCFQAASNHFCAVWSFGLFSDPFFFCGRRCCRCGGHGELKSAIRFLTVSDLGYWNVPMCGRITYLVRIVAPKRCMQEKMPNTRSVHFSPFLLFSQISVLEPQTTVSVLSESEVAVQGSETATWGSKGLLWNPQQPFSPFGIRNDPNDQFQNAQRLFVVPNSRKYWRLWNLQPPFWNPKCSFWTLKELLLTLKRLFRERKALVPVVTNTVRCVSFSRQFIYFRHLKFQNQIRQG